MGQGRRRRGLSPEDRDLWDRLKMTVAPLHPVTAPSPTPRPPDAKSATPPAGKSAHPVTPAMSPRPTERPHGRAAERAAPPDLAEMRMDHRRYEKMRRGRMTPDARLDLHGMTAHRAHAALNGFIASAHAAGHRLVLVITGKGRPTDDIMLGEDGPGVLRRSVPHWLKMAPNGSRVLQVSQAHRRHGGEGAYYVYLARRR